MNYANNFNNTPLNVCISISANFTGNRTVAYLMSTRISVETRMRGLMSI